MKKLAVMVEVDVATSFDPAFVFRWLRCWEWVWIVTTSLASLSLAAAATFYNSVSSVFEIEATVRTGRSEGEGGGRGGRRGWKIFLFKFNANARGHSKIRLRMEFGGFGWNWTNDRLVYSKQQPSPLSASVQDIYVLSTISIFYLNWGHATY